LEILQSLEKTGYKTKFKNSILRHGYCCINLTLGETQGQPRITTNRSMVKKTFLTKGLEYAAELALSNCRDLVQVIKWNNQQGIKMYRMSSDIFPWCSEYELSDLPGFDEIRRFLQMAGEEAKSGDQRLTFHPSHFAVLASNKENVVAVAQKDLRQHAEIMDLMGLDQSYFYPINVHVNTAQPTKEEAAERFCHQVQLTPPSVRKRLVVEVDDKKSGFHAEDLFQLVHQKTGIPITFDYLHNQCHPSTLSEEEALQLCFSTWPADIPPIVHFSSSKKKYEDPKAREVAHSDWIYESVANYGLEIDIEFEVKMKELALLAYLRDFPFIFP
jgi:UV DNA damage endonuclease